MVEDLNRERKGKRVWPKQAALDEYRKLMRETFALEHAGTDVPEPVPDAIAVRVREPEWVPATRRLLAGCSDGVFVSLLGDWQVVAALLGTVKKRDRAVLLTVELLCFHPWPSKIEFVRGLRNEKVEAIAAAFGAPVGTKYVRDIEHDIVSRTRWLALKLGWRRIALIAAGGIALGAITGGLGAVAVGTAIGGAMGLSGAAAANAGLALLGGGSLAAGGMGVAGGTLVVTGVASVGVGAAAGGGTAVHAMSAAEVLADMVKVAVVTKYVMLREQSEPDKARTVVGLTEQALREADAEAERLRAQLKELSELKTVAEASVEALKAYEEENDALKARLKAAEERAKVYEAGAASLRSEIESYREAA